MFNTVWNCSVSSAFAKAEWGRCVWAWLFGIVLLDTFLEFKFLDMVDNVVADQLVPSIAADNSYANIPTTPYELPDGQ